MKLHLLYVVFICIDYCCNNRNRSMEHYGCKGIGNAALRIRMHTVQEAHGKDPKVLRPGDHAMSGLRRFAGARRLRCRYLLQGWWLVQGRLRKRQAKIYGRERKQTQERFRAERRVSETARYVQRKLVFLQQRRQARSHAQRARCTCGNVHFQHTKEVMAFMPC